MTMNKKLLTLAAAFAVCMAASAPAFADDWRHHDNGHHYGWSHDRDRFYAHERHERSERSERYYTPSYPAFRPHDRVVIREYYGPVVYRPVPPAWRVGYTLPYYTHYEYLSPRLLTRLQPVPVGYEYVKVDGNVLLIQDATRLVVDALTLS
jgi:Ni/Co efflux regulator RcnB